MGPRGELEDWVRPKVEAWVHRVRILAKIAKWYTQSAYAGLGMLLQLDWQYLQRTFPGVVSLMGPVEESLREVFLPTLFGGEEVSADLRKILGQSVKRGSLGIPDPGLSEERAYNTSKSASKVLVSSLLVGTKLKYVTHKGCVRRASDYKRKQRELADKAMILRRKELADWSELNRLWRST